MTDTRTVFASTPAGFKPGVNIMNEDGENRSFTAADGYWYSYHATIDAVSGKFLREKGGAGIKVEKFHISFYGSDGKKYGLVSWIYKSSPNRYEISDETGLFLSDTPTRTQARGRAMAHLSQKCKFGVQISSPWPLAPVVIAGPVRLNNGSDREPVAPPVAPPVDPRSASNTAMNKRLEQLAATGRQSSSPLVHSTDLTSLPGTSVSMPWRAPSSSQPAPPPPPVRNPALNSEVPGKPVPLGGPAPQVNNPIVPVDSGRRRR